MKTSLFICSLFCMFHARTTIIIMRTHTRALRLFQIFFFTYSLTLCCCMVPAYVCFVTAHHDDPAVLTLFLKIELDSGHRGLDFGDEQVIQSSSSSSALPVSYLRTSSEEVDMTMEDDLILAAFIDSIDSDDELLFQPSG